MLPLPGDGAALGLASGALLEQEALAMHRVRLARALHSLRVASAAVVDGIRRWRVDVRAAARGHLTPPQPHLTLARHGVG